MKTELPDELQRINRTLGIDSKESFTLASTVTFIKIGEKKMKKKLR